MSSIKVKPRDELRACGNGIVLLSLPVSSRQMIDRWRRAMKPIQDSFSYASRLLGVSDTSKRLSCDQGSRE
jgi:hypothetical protein